ncbi:MAG TPA: hypothetical protein VL326_34950 [Kofleriaceae bacterium]|nr:hypothetical protein [Kofleriaceae bacterium]
MRRLLLSTLLIASPSLALAQGSGDGAPPPDDAKKADGDEAKKAGGDDAKKPDGGSEAKKAPPDEGGGGGGGEGEGEGEGEPVAAPEPPPEEKPAVTAHYDKGLKFESSDKKYELKLMFRSQVRLESLRPTEDNSQFINRFYISRARFQAEGHVFGDETRYKLELGLGDASTTPSATKPTVAGSFSYIKDMFIEHRVAPAPVWLRAGQWKRPFNRQEMVSDFASEFNERSIENELAGGGRDLGVALHNDYEKTAEGIEWVFGMFNGFSGGSDRPKILCTTDAVTGAVTCIPTTLPGDFGPTLVARAGWNSARAKGYSEADLEGGPLRYSVGAAYKVDLANFAKHDETSLADNLSHGLEVDWNVKVEGISLSGGAVMMKIKSKDPELGFVLQPGLMIVPKHVEVAARFALTTEGDRNNIEALGAFNYFVHGHQLKIASDFGILKKTGEDPTTMMSDKPDIRVRIMGQLEL